MNQLTIVFVDEAGTELNRYELEDVATGVKTDVRLLRDAVFYCGWDRFKRRKS